MIEIDKDMIDNELSVPKYEQLNKILLEYISALPPEVEYLPYEYDLARKMGVSRRTVRNTYDLLRKNGIIETVKKRGSKILRRNTMETRPISVSAAIGGKTIGILFSNDSDRPGRSDYLPWQVANSLEDVLGSKNCSLLVYNLRQQDWERRQSLIEQIQQSGIDFAAVYPSDGNEQLIPLMLQQGIKPVLVLSDTRLLGVMSKWLEAGVNYITVNHIVPITYMLKDVARNAKQIIYVTSAADEIWSEPRSKCCSEYAAQTGASYACLVMEFKSVTDATHSMNEYQLVRYNAGLEAAERINQMSAGRKDVLVVVANDRLACGVIDRLRALGRAVPGEIKIVGYDNIEGLRGNNISTFDFNTIEIAKAIFEMYCDHVENAPKSFASSTGKITFSRFLPRATT